MTRLHVIANLRDRKNVHTYKSNDNTKQCAQLSTPHEKISLS